MLLLFILLLLGAVYSAPFYGNLNFFLRMDPSLVAGTALSGRTLSLAFVPAAVVLLLVPLIGRVFCGYACPMGTTIDGCDRLFGGYSKKPGALNRLTGVKYLILIFLFGASILGVSFIFLVSPLSLITRFYGLLLYPVASLLGSLGLKFIQPLAEQLDLNSLVFMEPAILRFSTNLFIFLFFLGLFSMARVAPRFWCRYICPSGALMALVSRRPVLRRYVNSDCIHCGRCADACPMGAVGSERPDTIDHRECIVCRKCEHVCPVKAISFTGAAAGAGRKNPGFMPARRRFLIAGLAGAGTAAVGLTGLGSLQEKTGPGRVLPPGLVRPPGSIPEREFLALCVRCGECMIACPTNALQPVWAEAGFTALFSPALRPRRGACSPECNRCGTVCPTSAIRELPLFERQWAKMGTAVISRERCLAWEQKKRCMVCDEVCPYGAVRFRYEPGNPVPVPEVYEDRCSGCGHCEHHCPVQNRSAIVVTPMGALRLKEGSFRRHGEAQGIQISLKHKEDKSVSVTEEGIAPGFED